MARYTSSPYTLQSEKIIDVKVSESGELLSCVGYLSTTIEHPIFYTTPIYGNIETIIPLRNFIQRNISVSKIRSISETPYF